MPDSDDTDSDLERRRLRLSERLSSRDDETDALSADDDSAPSPSGIGYALSLGSSFVAAILVGAVLGYLIDSFLGVSPFGLITLLLLGFCAGILNILRSAGLASRSRLNFHDASGIDSPDTPKKSEKIRKK